MKLSRIATIASGLAVATAALPRLANACAMCGLSPGDSAGHAYNTSVLFMLAGPYVTVGLVGGIIYLAWKRAQRRSGAAVVNRN